MGNVMSIGRSRAKTYAADKPSTTFADIAGYEGVKQEIREVVDFLRMPDQFKEIGARVPKGILLVGPPGTGKTLFARAVAGEAGVGFLSGTGSDFMEMFVGVGASRVRDLFQQARKMGRAIIFIDEIDSIGRKRGAGLGGGHDEREQTLNQMLSEMDGFETVRGRRHHRGHQPARTSSTPPCCAPAGSTARSWCRCPSTPSAWPSSRSTAGTSACRPTSTSRPWPRARPGMSGADLANLVNEAALFAVRRGAKEIERIDFESARDRIMMGARRESLILTQRGEARPPPTTRAATPCWPPCSPTPTRCTRSPSSPPAWRSASPRRMPEERHAYSRDHLLDRICMTMGGRVAEELVFNQRTTGAANDLEVATRMAKRMVREWGMSDRIGPMAWESQGQVFLGEDLMTGQREYSDDTARLIDEEVARILREQEDRARTLLTKHRRGLDLVAKALLEQETVEGSEVARLVQEGLTPAPAPSPAPTG